MSCAAACVAPRPSDRMARPAPSFECKSMIVVSQCLWRTFWLRQLSRKVKSVSSSGGAGSQAHQQSPTDQALELRATKVDVEGVPFVIRELDHQATIVGLDDARATERELAFPVGEFGRHGRRDGRAAHRRAP